MIYKREKTWWMDAVIDGQRYRESLRTTDRREAKDLEKRRISEIQGKAPSTTRHRKTFANLPIAEAIDVYIQERSAQISRGMISYLRNQAKPLAKSKALGRLPLKKITITNISYYQSERLSDGRAPKTINGEMSVLRQLLTHARLWYRIKEDYKPIPNTKSPTGRALTEEEMLRLFEVASQRSDWRYAHAAIILSFCCGMRSCEIKALRWEDVHFDAQVLDIKRSKTQAGHRSPSLNLTTVSVLQDLHEQAKLLGAGEPKHFVFPWHGREQKIDPTKPITSWRSAFRSIVKFAGLDGLRFHDGRHTAITKMAEKGLSDWVIQAQVGHVDSKMMKTYSHIRRLALNEAAAALEPTARLTTGAVLEECLVG